MRLPKRVRRVPQFEKAPKREPRRNYYKEVIAAVEEANRILNDPFGADTSTRGQRIIELFEEPRIKEYMEKNNMTKLVNPPNHERLNAEIILLKDGKPCQ